MKRWEVLLTANDRTVFEVPLSTTRFGESEQEVRSHFTTLGYRVASVTEVSLK